MKEERNRLGKAGMVGRFSERKASRCSVQAWIVGRLVDKPFVLFISEPNRGLLLSNKHVLSLICLSPIDDDDKVVGVD